MCEDQVDDRMNAQVCTDTVQVDGKKSVMVPTDVAQAQVDDRMSVQVPKCTDGAPVDDRMSIQVCTYM